ncbi:MAG: amidase [Cyanobacteria bacterium J06635_1]
MSLSLPFLTAEKASLKIAQGQLTTVELLQACLRRIEDREPSIHAWQYLKLDQALQQAATWDKQNRTFGTTDRLTAPHPLSGIPIAVKDIFATVDMPTGWGTAIYRGRYLDHEAAVVTRLKQAGAIILGKTVTTELATAAAGPTTNPHNLTHTPGGSSSGSAAAVADGMVPLAIGSQTMGSILRPAAYCGIFGFKPSFGLISRDGMMPVSRDLDHVGVFARGLGDIQLLLDVLIGQDDQDPECQGYGDLEHSREDPSWALRLAFIKTPRWEKAEAVMKSRLSEAISVLERADISIEPVVLPPELAGYWGHVQDLCAYGLWHNHGSLLATHGEQCSPVLRAWFLRGQQISASHYDSLSQCRQHYQHILKPFFDHYDAFLTPVTLGPAPLGLANTGSPIFCGLWTLCGLPALNLPLGQTDKGLPLGCQLVGAPYADQKLLWIARHCWPILRDAFGDIQRPLS